MQNFYLFRKEDNTGVSGIGFVAEGTVFKNGKIVMAWRTEHTSVCLYDSMDTLLKIHGHEGKTQLLWATEFISQEGHPIAFGGTGFSDMITNQWLGSQDPREYGASLASEYIEKMDASTSETEFYLTQRDWDDPNQFHGEDGDGLCALCHGDEENKCAFCKKHEEVSS